MKLVEPVAALLVLAASGAHADDRRPDSFTVFQHDTSQAQLDLGAPGPSVGDQYIFGGDVSARHGGRVIGRSAGHCASSSDTEMLCAASIGVGDGQITIEGLIDDATFFSNQPVDFAVTGGTGPYRQARGTVTITILPDPPDGSDAKVVFHLK